MDIVIDLADYYMYDDSEFDELEAQMDAYISVRDAIARIQDAVASDSLAHRKSLALTLFRLLDHLSSVNNDYTYTRDKLTVVKGSPFHLTPSSYPFDPEVLRMATQHFYEQQERLHRLLIAIGDIRKKLSQVSDGQLSQTIAKKDS